MKEKNMQSDQKFWTGIITKTDMTPIDEHKSLLHTHNTTKLPNELNWRDAVKKAAATPTVSVLGQMEIKN